MADKKLLLVCYHFPPNAGIGGRRWAKLAKGLTQLGYHIHVIKADPISGTNPSGWADDINRNAITVHSVKRNYPTVVSHGPKNIVDKLRYRYHVNQLKNKEKGTIYDIAIGWDKRFFPFAKNLIEKEGITDILATGAPFNLLYYCAQLKDFFPEINLIADYRDPWLSAENYGMKDLTDERMTVETEKQELLFQNANWITCPNEFLLADIRSTAVIKPKAEFTAMPHFFDKDDLKKYLVDYEKTDDKVKIVYGGAIYLGMERHLERLARALRYLAKNQPLLAAKLDIRLYTPHHRFAEIFQGLEKFVQFKETIGKEFFSELNSADAAFIFLAEHNRNFLTTKFFEYLPFNKPLLYLGAEGYVSGFIEDNDLGVSLRSEEHIGATLKELAEGNLKIKSSIDVKAFSLKRRARELAALLS